MDEVDLELTKAHLRGRGLGGNVHSLAAVIEIVEEGVESIERPQAQDLGAGAAFARARRFRLADLRARIVDEIEFHLGRHDRRQAKRLVALKDV